MKKKLWLLFTGFVVFYFLLHVGRQLPGMLQGRSGWVSDAGDRPVLPALIKDMLIGFGFVFAAYSILYYLYPRKKIPMISFCAIISFGIMFFIEYMAAWLDAPYGVRMNGFFRSNVLYFVLYSGFGSTWYFIRYAQYRELRETAIELTAKKTELSFLRAQVNPHFLFNNLNNIYSLVHGQSEAALPAIAALSDMLRYMLYEKEESVPLQSEINCIRQYLALEKLRSEKSEYVDFLVEGDTTNKTIAPLLLLPLVENAYKHGDVGNDKDWLSMHIHSSADKIIFCIKNKKTSRPSPVPGGLGLAQTGKRLELVYPGRHKLYTDDTTGFFTVTLMIENGH